MEEEEEEEEEEDDTSSIATGLASPAQSISQLLGSALRSGSAPRSAARTISRQQAASHLKATTRRKITSQHDDDDASDGEAVGRDDEDDGEEEGGTPVVTISRSLRRLTRAMSHTLSGAPPMQCCSLPGHPVEDVRKAHQLGRHNVRHSVRHSMARLTPGSLLQPVEIAFSSVLKPLQMYCACQWHA